ncbi:MAG: cysteine--tRNA ligase [Candidatus Bipolaricaulota bacterium]
MRLYNSLTRQLEPFSPRDGKTVGMYVCGPTVYDHLHIGNVRPVIVFGALRRYLVAFKGWHVLYVQNITDVDDKLIQRAESTGATVESVAAKYAQAYFDLLEALGIERPTASPRATEHIEPMVALIGRLVERGAAYVRGGDVYFRVEKADGYGTLSGRRLEDQEAGARVEVALEKEHPLDFTLWKAAKPGEPSWPSPWGAGRPGWHTECVVMSRKYLGEFLDIHAGGNDLMFPHHENEIAQANASGEGPFFRFWLHNGMLHLGGQEMHKSLGNFRYAHEILAAYDAQTVAYFYLSRHYRKPLEFSDEGLRAAQAAVRRVQSLVSDIERELPAASGETAAPASAFQDSLAGFRERYVDAMDDDFNTVDALAAVHDAVSATNRFRAEAQGSDRLALRGAVSLLRELGAPLGLFGARRVETASSLESPLIELLLSLRSGLRARKAFDLSDQVRDGLAALGVEIKDTPQGTFWSRSEG